MRLKSRLDNMLLAAVEKEMHDGARQLGKGMSKAQEVMGLFQVAVDLEKEQSASMPRLIPDEGSMQDMPGKGYW
jgi:hypothetical protein